MLPVLACWQMHLRAASGAFLLCYLFGVPSARAQEILAPYLLPARSGAASPTLDPSHWAVGAAARAESLGLVSHYLPAQRAVSRGAVAAALREASLRAPFESPHLAGLAEGWFRRFQEEFRELDDAVEAERSHHPFHLGSAADVGVRGYTGVVTPGSGIFAERTDPRTLPDLREGYVEARLAASPVSWLAASIEADLGTQRPEVPRWEIAARWGGAVISVGDQPVGYGSGRGGGVVLSGVSLPTVQLQTAEPFHARGMLDRVGPISFHTFLTRLSDPRHPSDPWFWGMRGSVQPHPRFTVSVNRAAFFGGRDTDVPFTLRNLTGVFVGVLNGGFENQLVSVDFRFRLPTERALPLTVYMEWGAEDAAGAWWDVPGIVAGAFAPAVPGIPALAVGVEHASFATFCCGNPPWYFHAGFPGGWVANDTPLGHPLGGEGSETMLYLSTSVADARLRTDARFFRRDRSDAGYATSQRAGNLYVPQRAGTSWGAELRGTFGVFARAEISAWYSVDSGAGWTEQRFSAGTAVFF